MEINKNKDKKMYKNNPALLLSLILVLPINVQAATISFAGGGTSTTT